MRWLAVLRSCGAAEAYAHYYSLRIEPARVIEFLLLNPLFPQSVRFCLDTAMEALEGIAGPVAVGAPGAGKGDLAVRALGLLRGAAAAHGRGRGAGGGAGAVPGGRPAPGPVVSEHVTPGYLRDEPQPGPAGGGGAGGDDHGDAAATAVSAVA